MSFPCGHIYPGTTKMFYNPAPFVRDVNNKARIPRKRKRFFLWAVPPKRIKPNEVRVNPF